MEVQGFCFGPFRFDPDAEVLFRGDELVNLGRREVLLLGALLRKRGKIVTKTELLDAAWPDQSVVEANLSVQIANLRKSLGTSPNWITTVERVGYRFRDLAGTDHRASLGRNSALPSLAVLPFVVMSHSEGLDDFAAGLVEDLTSALARFTSLHVVARTSSSVHGARPVDVRDTARQLSVGYVLEGSVRCSAGRIRVSAQLIEGSSGSHVWAQNFDGMSDNSLDLQEDLARAVAAGVEAQVEMFEVKRSLRDRPHSSEAYDLLIRGKFKKGSQREDENGPAYALMMQALDLEPENPTILAAAASCLVHRITMGWSSLNSDDRATAVALAKRGVPLSVNDADALARFGMAFVCARDFDLGYATIERALEANPTSPTVLQQAGISSRYAGKLDLAEEYFRRSLSLNGPHPQRCFALTGIAVVERRRGHFEEALIWAKRSLTINYNLSSTHWNLIASSVGLGRKEDARRYYERYLALVPGVTTESIRAGQPEEHPSTIEPLLEALWQAGMPER